MTRRASARTLHVTHDHRHAAGTTARDRVDIRKHVCLMTRLAPTQSTGSAFDTLFMAIAGGARMATTQSSGRKRRGASGAAGDNGAGGVGGVDSQTLLGHYRNMVRVRLFEEA